MSKADSEAATMGDVRSEVGCLATCITGMLVFFGLLLGWVVHHGAEKCESRGMVAVWSVKPSALQLKCLRAPPLEIP